MSAIPRLCELCHKPVAFDWDYAWCKACGETGVCRHGSRPHECNECMIEADFAFDAARESRTAIPERDAKTESEAGE